MKYVKKPNTSQAMRQLIEDIRTAIPFGMSEAELCSGICYGCAKKMLAFLETELDSWEYRIHQGEQPSFGDLEKLAKTGKKIYRALLKNGLITA